ncbi:type II toxin-antitoxin system VapC family toxin [Planktothricoides raciborskii]|uniref:PIN domain-containing protein n=2 Tax=Planktothricoides raciborskii TaxID=132608 RepID=A0AAU8JD50_9CYAN|nr:PIN domain-containing protein [Planktothricoides raciborskii]MBD2547678.1 type II toxin-antitoxin system VapC family toxin [Planktothricoides raciborskii FACHB-1370]MBD2586129.1 type II toxin-antitoxin system VapC family toxin [Planktothricoides raciborskii FACHB-1261]
MKKIFVDTSAFAALADKNDDNHIKAVEFNRQVKGIILVTSNYILDELYTLLLMNVGYDPTVKFKAKLDILIAHNLLQIVWIFPEINRKTWQIFEQFNRDKQWSFTDCTSYVVMKESGITEAFTFDRHFSQMGFIRRPD